MKEVSNMNWHSDEVYNYQAKIPLKIPGYDELYKMMNYLMSVYVSSENKHIHMLIVGAEGGQELITLGNRNKGWAFTGVDPSIKMLGIAQRRSKKAGINATFIHGEVESITGKFTGATCMLVLHFLKEAEACKLLKEISERLKSGAPLFVASIVGKKGREFQWQMKAYMLSNGIPIEEWLNFEKSIDNTIHLISSAKMKHLLNRSGFTEVTKFYKGFLVEGWVGING
ncbi:methyltransferase domain-containing protein [Priestia filamentosa]|uniref:class I SAM-dependent methyltransferase n=1 Tax=Priestia filamentosa TaxID=1402861 RepID=UPI001FB38BFC|nr:class I SAM-dependent methyltransferase [Priestia filamentosa]UOE62098.1 methyltransferase domain-containing protein [Priestia filamentosa]